MKKGVLALVEIGITTEYGRICTRRTWFVNPNIMCCSPKDGVDKATKKHLKSRFVNPYLKATAFFFDVVLANLFSTQLAFIAKPTDKKQNNGYRLGLAIIRAEPIRLFAQK